MKMAKSGIVRSMRKFVLQVLIVGASLVLLINGSFLLMAWIVKEVLHIENVYLSSEVQFLGTLIIALLALIVVFILAYRKRKQELTTLSENIERVANGNYGVRIKYNKRDSMAHVYRNFNKMSAELANVQFLRKDFINRFSHEYKTPIASINGFASLLLEKELSKEEQMTYLSIIRDETERLSNLTSNTILLTKLSSQEVIADIETYDLAEQLRQCAIILSPQWLEKKQEFECDFPKTMYAGNRELMQHLWLNIMGNAVSHTQEGGKIRADMISEEHMIEVRVSDNGEGMDEETRQHLFEPYYQGKMAASGQGLGLGLSIAKRIVELCDGTIEVESEHGKGSVFRVKLPC